MFDSYQSISLVPPMSQMSGQNHYLLQNLSGDFAFHKTTNQGFVSTVLLLLLISFEAFINSVILTGRAVYEDEVDKDISAA